MVQLEAGVEAQVVVVELVDAEQRLGVQIVSGVAIHIIGGEGVQ